MKIFKFCASLLVWSCALDFEVAESVGIRERRSGQDDDEGHSDEGQEEGHGDHSTLIKSLFKNYDSSSSPTHGTGEPTVVNVNLQLISLDDINDAKMELILDTRITFFWSDPRLSTPECRDEGDDCDDHFDLKERQAEMWTPDLYVINSRQARQHQQPTANGMVYLVATGLVYLSKRLTLTLRCPMNLMYYPLDTQKCPLLICPYSLPDSELELKWTEKGVGLLEMENDGQNKFHLLHPITTGHSRHKYEGPDISGSFSCVNATFSLKRQNGYHMVYSYTVTSFIVCVSWIGFWLPATAVPARVTLGITTLLTLLTTGNFVRSSLPPVAYVTAIDVWVSCCTFFVLMSLLLFPVSHYLLQEKIVQQKNRHIHPADVCKVCRSFKSVPPTPLGDKEAVTAVDRRCRFAFPFVFVTFIVAYWSYYMSSST